MNACRVSNTLSVRLLALRENMNISLALIKNGVDIDNPSTAFQEIARHFQHRWMIPAIILRFMSGARSLSRETAESQGHSEHLISFLN